MHQSSINSALGIQSSCPYFFLSFAHPYKSWFLIQMSVASGLFLTAYSLTKGYLLLELASNLNNLAASIFSGVFLCVLGVIYPLLWLWTLYSLLREGSQKALLIGWQQTSALPLGGFYREGNVLWLFLGLFQLFWLFFFQVW